MDKRIKTVYAVSIVTMLLMLVGQVYWLYNQYQYSASTIMEKMQPVCTKLIQQEEGVRYDLLEKKWKSKLNEKDTLKIGIQIKIDRRNHDKNSYASTFTYTLLDGRTKVINASGLNSKDAGTIYDRYEACRYQPFQQHLMDSLLAGNGYGRTYGFKRLSHMRLVLQPQYSSIGFWYKGLHVVYCSNPMFQEGVEFDVPLPTMGIIKSMTWQLLLSFLLVCVIAFCLYYQVKTIVIQKRIDGIRREFLKNMIYESKQPKEEADSEGCIKVGDTEFRYGLNELRHGNERIILTSRQAEIFRLLASSPNIVISREQILNEAWGDDSYSNSLALNVQMSYLRRAIKSDGLLSIDVVYKKGYVLNVK